MAEKQEKQGELTHLFTQTTVGGMLMMADYRLRRLPGTDEPTCERAGQIRYEDGPANVASLISS